MKKKHLVKKVFNSYFLENFINFSKFSKKDQFLSFEKFQNFLIFKLLPLILHRNPQKFPDSDTFELPTESEEDRQTQCILWPYPPIL